MMELVILGTVLPASFGIAYALQRAALRLVFKAMETAR
jgi:hypothetical protein